MSFELLLFEVLALISVLYALDCGEVEFYLSQVVKNSGFHRSFEWSIVTFSRKSDIKEQSKCRYALQIDMPPEMFVNPDEIAELNRKKVLSTYIDGIINIEAPTHDSEGHSIYVFLDNKNINNISLSLPVHLRYHRAVFGGGYEKFVVQKPSLLARCPSDGPKFCAHSKTHTVCDSKGINQCVWQNITYKPLFEDAEFSVPVGDLNHYPIVSTFSLILGCAGCIYVLSILK